MPFFDFLDGHFEGGFPCSLSRDAVLFQSWNDDGVYGIEKECAGVFPVTYADLFFLFTRGMPYGQMREFVFTQVVEGDDEIFCKSSLQIIRKVRG